MSVSDRLARLLFIVPYVADRDGVPVAELAKLLEVKPRQIETDLEILSMVGQPPLTPDHLIDLYIEDDVVYVDLDQSLSRPLRLTHDEARALALAAKLVGDLGGLGRELDGAVEKILELLNPVDAERVRSLAKRVSLGQDNVAEPTAGLRRAIEQHLEVEINYYSVSSDRQKRYRLRPLALINHTGVEYFVALDVGAELQEKLFRFDRVGEVAVQTQHFEAPSDFDLEKFRRETLYFGNDTLTARVRFDVTVAREVRERFADRHVEELADGAVEVHLSTSSAAWLARWVLPFGVHAEVVGPQSARDAIAALCEQAADAYGTPLQDHESAQKLTGSSL